MDDYQSVFFQLMDKIIDVVTNDTEKTVDFVSVLLLEWKSRHEGSEVMLDVIIPAMQQLGAQVHVNMMAKIEGDE